MADQLPLGTLVIGTVVSGGTSIPHNPPTSPVGINAGVTGAPTNVQLLTGAGFEVRVYDILNPNTALLAVIPNPETIAFEDDLSAVGSGQVTVATDDMNPAIFAKDHVWKIYWEGVERFAFIAEQIQDVTVGADEVHRRTIAGKGTGQWLDKMLVYPAGSLSGAPDATRTFINVSRAGIVYQLLQEGWARGTANFVTAANWSATTDSEGVSWTDTNQTQIQAGETMLTVVTDMGQATPFDWHMDSKFGLSLAKNFGTNRSATVRVQPIGSVITSTVTRDRNNLYDAVLVQDANGGFSEQVDAPTVTAWGRREQFASSQNVVDATGRTDLAYQLVQQWKSESVERLVDVATAIPGRRPLIDYGLGDIISVEFTDGSVINSRVIAIAMAGGDAVAEECQITLDFMLENKANAGTTAAPNPVTSGAVTVYADNGASPLTIGTSVTIAINMQLQAFLPTYASCDTYIRGQASVLQTIQADVYMNSLLIRSMKQVLAAGEVTFTPTFMITSVPQGTNTIQLRLSVNTGTLAIAAFDCLHWYTGSQLGGGIPIGSTSISLVEVIAGWATTITDPSRAITRQTPTPATKTESVAAYVTITDVPPTLTHTP